MNRLANFSGSEILSFLYKKGFVLISQKGSHQKLRKIIDGKIVTVIVPDHSELAPGTLRNILRQAEISLDEFFEN
ncbi:MAG: type II toxin-antitoxin system HicA family toxin [Candidatus Magasanikbacteria bacterium]|jgi:predicted RNA binding protein YcfA (HicA-like mRNA interferase family)